MKQPNATADKFCHFLQINKTHWTGAQIALINSIRNSFAVSIPVTNEEWLNFMAIFVWQYEWFLTYMENGTWTGIFKDPVKPNSKASVMCLFLTTSGLRFTPTRLKIINQILVAANTSAHIDWHLYLQWTSIAYPFYELNEINKTMVS